MAVNERLVDFDLAVAIAQRGMAWARSQSWTAAVDNVIAAIEHTRMIYEKLMQTA